MPDLKNERLVLPSLLAGVGKQTKWNSALSHAFLAPTTNFNFLD